MTTALNEILTTTYSAYHSRRDLPEDAELTRVGRGTPMGEYMRRFWQPVAYASEVTDLPLEVRLLGEDLVLFRTARGAYGLVEQQRSQSAYPLHVFFDLIFAYMGPPEKQPPFPMLDLYDDPNMTLESGIERSTVTECNWLQIHENAMDPVHTAYLHALTTGTQRGFSDAMGVVPVLQWVQSEIGMYYIAVRRVDDSAVPHESRPRRHLAARAPRHLGRADRRLHDQTVLSALRRQAQPDDSLATAARFRPSERPAVRRAAALSGRLRNDDEPGTHRDSRL
jgi:hypothetical protein